MNLHAEDLNTGPSFFAADLAQWKDASFERNIIDCFFIVEHTKDSELVRLVAVKLLEAGCRWFHFFGKQEQLWHWGFDEADVRFNPDLNDETVALTAGYSDLDDFSREIYVRISGEQNAQDVVYFLYDDEEIYREVLRRLRVVKMSKEGS